MASYQARQRDPLLHQSTQAMLERRGRELLGLALVLAALVFALTVVKVKRGEPMQGYDHVIQSQPVPKGAGG